MCVVMAGRFTKLVGAQKESNKMTTSERTFNINMQGLFPLLACDCDGLF